MPRIYDFNDFIKHVYGKEGSIFSCVLGPNGSGKTLFNLLQMERIHDLGLGVRYGSNMPVPSALKPEFEMDFIEDFETLEHTCRMLNPDPEKKGMKKYFFFLSELGKFVPKDQAWKKDNIEFISSLQTVRKFGLCLLSDAIDRVDGRVLSPSFFNGVFNKPFPENPQYAEWTDFRSGRKIVFKDIPKCKMWFDTYYSANFYMKRQAETTTALPLDNDHIIIKAYIEANCRIANTGYHSQEVKRARDNIIKRYWKQFIEPNPSEEIANKEPSIVEET